MAGKRNFDFDELNGFLTEPDKEFQNYLKIAQKNLNAFLNFRANISASCDSLNDSVQSQKNNLNKCVELIGQGATNKIIKKRNQIQIGTLLGSSKKLENQLKNLELSLKRRIEEYEKLKASKELEIRANKNDMKAYKKAVTFFIRRFQYTITTGCINKEYVDYDISFIFENQESKYPIRFIFDEQGNCSSFNAGTLMSQQQQALLFENYKKTNNNLALFCTLRDVALKKHISSS